MSTENLIADRFSRVGCVHPKPQIEHAEVKFSTRRVVQRQGGKFEIAVKPPGVWQNFLASLRVLSF